MIFAFLTVSLRANQVVTGLALTIFGTGFSSFMGKGLVGIKLSDEFSASFTSIKIPGLGDIPVIGEILFNHDILVYLGYLTAILIGLYMYNTRKGLNLRAVGENPAAADAASVRITAYKYGHILLGGALCGLGGAYLSLVQVPVWQENITAGRGWIAVALVIFAAWNPYKDNWVLFLWRFRYYRLPFARNRNPDFSVFRRYASLLNDYICAGYCFFEKRQKKRSSESSKRTLFPRGTLAILQFSANRFYMEAYSIGESFFLEETSRGVSSIGFPVNRVPLRTPLTVFPKESTVLLTGLSKILYSLKPRGSVSLYLAG